MKSKLKAKLMLVGLVIVFLSGAATTSEAAVSSRNCRQRCNEIYRLRRARCNNLSGRAERRCEQQAREDHRQCLNRCSFR